MGSLLDIQSQIEKLQRQANDIRTREFDKTVQEIVAKMQAFGITQKDLQSATARTAKSAKASRKKTALPGSKSGKTAGSTVAPKYRGPNGETWSGRGLMPRWLKTLIEQGGQREEFAIGK